MTILVQRASDVRITEVDISQIIVSASTSIASQVIVSKQGSTKPKRFTNPTDYLNEYGNPDASVSFDVYCGLDYFREGNDLWAIRVTNSDALYSGVIVYDDGGVTTADPVGSGVVNPELPAWSTLAPSPKTPLFLVYPNKGPGSYGDNVAVRVLTNNVMVPTGVAVTSSTTGGTLSAGTYTYQVSAVGAQGETLASTSAQVVIAGGGSTHSTTISWNLDPRAFGYRIYGRVAGSIYFIAEVGQGNVSYVDQGLIVPDVTRPPITNPANAPAPTPVFTIQVFDLNQSSDTPMEEFECSMTSMIDDTGTDMEIEAKINPFSQYIQVTSNAASLVVIPEIKTTAQVALAGGDSGTAPTNFQVANAWGTFSNKQLYNVNIQINGGKSNAIVQRAMDALSQARGDTVSLLDTPPTKQQFQAAIDYRNLELNLNSSYSALFCPDVMEADNINGKTLYVPFSGWAAALCARTDRVANPAFSIAGLNRGLVDVLKTRYTYDDGQASAMFRAGVNYTRTFTGQGIALWEQKTLLGKQSALSWLSVRRIVNVLKTAMYNFLVYGLQEPNDDFTRRQLVGASAEYLETLKNARAINSYRVVSDSSNNTAAMFNAGILGIDVIIVPMIPVHEIDLRVIISKEGIRFDEVLNAL